MIRTIIFEDDEIDVRGIRDLIKGVASINIIGVYSTIQDGLRACRELRPDLLLVDADIRGDKTAGPRFVQAIKQMHCQARILGLTKYPECLKPLQFAGCNEVVLKQFFDDEEIARKYIEESLLNNPVNRAEMELPVLTREEDTVLRMIASGRTENEMGLKLTKTRKQIRLLKSALKLKFGATRDPQLVSHAYRCGYLRPGDPDQKT